MFRKWFMYGLRASAPLQGVWGKTYETSGGVQLNMRRESNVSFK